MLAFVTNSTSTFNLGAEEIIYLNDIGVPSAVVTAMIQRDQVLKSFRRTRHRRRRRRARRAGTLLPNRYPRRRRRKWPRNRITRLRSTRRRPTARMRPSTTHWRPMARGLTLRATGLAGSRPWSSSIPAGSLTAMAAGGSIPIAGGTGGRVTPGAGRRSTTVAGSVTVSMAGAGRRATPGVRPGCPGDITATIAAGRRCRRQPGITPASGSRITASTSIAASLSGLVLVSYTFVPVSHFSDPHLSRHALPHQQATQIYHQTVPSVTIVGNSTRVINRGIPVSRVETATQTQIHQVGIREANTPAAQGTRGERLERQQSDPVGVPPAVPAVHRGAAGIRRPLAV